MLSITKPGLFNMLSTNRIHQCFLLCRLTRTPRTRPHTCAHAHAHTENAVPRGSMLFLATPGTTATRPRGRPRPPRRDPQMARAAPAGRSVSGAARCVPSAVTRNARLCSRHTQSRTHTSMLHLFYESVSEEPPAPSRSPLLTDGPERRAGRAADCCVIRA